MLLRQQRWVGPALLVILLLAAALRFWRLGELPPGLYHDEAYNGLDALSLLERRQFPQFYEGWELYAQDAHAERPPQPTRWPVFFEGNYGREPLHVYLMAASIALAGATPFAVRAVPAAAGVLAVLTTFLAARALFPARRSANGLSPWLLPLLAAFSIAVLYPAVHFSRFGIRAMLFVPCATLAVAAFWRAFSQPHRRALVWYAAAGFFVGLGLYTYAAARLLPLLFIAFALYLLLFDRPQLRAALLGLALMAAVAGVTALPLLLFFYRYPYYFTFRLAYVANRGAGTVPDAPWLTWLLNVGRVVGGFFWQGETHLRHNLPGRPYLDLIQRVLFLGGVGVALARRRKPEVVFLLLWLGVMLLPSILSGDAPHFGRLIGAAPPVAILIALGATTLLDWLVGRSWPRWALALLTAALFLPSLAWTARDYFITYANHPDLAADFYLADWEMGRFAAEQPADTALYLAPTQEEMATIYFALQSTNRLRSFSEGETLAPVGFDGRPILYLLRPGQGATLANLQGLFPTAAPGTPQAGFTPLPIAADAPREWPKAATPVTIGDTIQLNGTAIEQTDAELQVTLVWRALRVPERDLTVFVHVQSGDGTILAQTDRPPAGYPTTEWRPGEIIVDRVTVTLPPELAPGSYTVSTGFYDLPTLERMGEEILLGTVQVE